MARVVAIILFLIGCSMCSFFKNQVEIIMQNIRLKLILPNLIMAAGVWCSVANAAPGIKVLVTGDSVTRMTGTPCGTTTYLQCNQAGKIPHEYSYGSMLAGASNYEYTMVYNSGRGGDTCQTSIPWTSGAFTGLSRGLKDRISTTVTNQATAFGATVVSVLIGINDELGVEGWKSLSRTATINCLKDVWTQIRSAGFAVRALTYPKISPYKNAWGTLNSTTAYSAAQQLIGLNADIRRAVIDFNNAAGGVNPVVLVDAETAWTNSTTDLNAYIQSDGTHPNAAGANRIAHVWYYGY